MVLRNAGDAVLAIGQGSHAWLSGQIARAWGNERFPAPAPHEDVCLAAAQHDVGWAEWDLHPALNPGTGRPHSFLDMPNLATSIELWREAPDKVLTQSTYASLLVSMHGTALYERRQREDLSPGDAELVKRYLDRERSRQDELRAQLRPDEQQLARNQRLVWTWDSLSLALCLPWDPHTATRVPASDGEVDLHMRLTTPDRFELTPWPFTSSEVKVHCEGRRLAGRYETPVELHAALRDAPIEPLAFTLARPV